MRAWFPRAWRRRRAWLGAIVGVIGAIAGLLALDRLHPPNLARLSDTSVVVRDSRGGTLRAFLASDGHWRLPASVADVSPRLIDMLIAYEDKRFRWHPGVDPLAVLRAAGQAVMHGRVVSGASTLTMQVARLLEPRPRTFGAKLIEMARAVQLELHHGKDDILGMYLTLAPYGGNLAGARAASLAYFDKEPLELTDGEVALLAALPQSPSRLRPDRHHARAVAARDKVLTRAVERLGATAAAEAREQPVPAVRQRLPMDAPHLADRLRKDITGGPVDTTIDADLQRAMQSLVLRQQADLGRRAGIAVLAVENASRSVLAYVGGGAYFDEIRRGQIDMVRATRSPGSTLKPFVYAMAFDDGVLHPDTVINDTPTRFGDYAPTNFNHGFLGEVPARVALQQSLNVPAVAVLDRVGAARFAGALGDLGVPLTLPRSHGRDQAPGLPVVLGGVGLSLEKLVTLYAGLANDGAVAPLRLRQADPMPARDAPRLVGPEAARAVARILADAPPPEGVAAFAADRRRIAFKTGTSYGFRDAWAVGFSPRYTVGVWVGRPDGTPSPDHWGRNTAAPLLFRMFDLLPLEPRVDPEPEVAAELPPALKRLALRGETQRPLSARRSEPRLRILFPAEESAISPHEGKVAMKVAGGRLPLTWLIDGRPVQAPQGRRDLFWPAPADGFTRLTVVDADGVSATVAFRVVP